MASGVSVLPGVSQQTGIAGSRNGITAGRGVSGTNPNLPPVPPGSFLTNDAGSNVLTNDAGSNSLIPG